MNQELEQAVVKYGNDTWEDGYGQGVYEEQERIIKLLEDDQTNCFCDDCYTYRATEVPFEVKHNEYIIALIKGEK